MRVKSFQLILGLTFLLICNYSYSSGLDTTKILKKYNHGYIVTLKGDTIKGFVNYKSYLYLKFIDSDGIKSKFTASKIKGFGDYDENKNMESFYINHRENKYFLERVVSGPVTLYLNYEKVRNYAHFGTAHVGAGGVGVGVSVQFIDDLISKTMFSAYYFTKDNTLFCIPQARRQFIETMCEHLSDDEKLINRIKTNAYEFKDLIKIIEEYNSNKNLKNT